MAAVVEKTNREEKIEKSAHTFSERRKKKKETKRNPPPTTASHPESSKSISPFD